MTKRRNIESTPRSAPVGSPFDERRSGRAWNARYKYDEPSTRTSFAMRSQTHKIPEMIDPQALYSTNGQEAWRVLGIMAEFQMAADRLNGVRPAVSIFGSARTKEDHPYYQVAKTIARKLSDAGFSVISGGGPGIMQAANHGAHAGRAPAIGLTLVQTGKSRRIPTILVGGAYWQGLLDWLNETVAAEGMIGERDIDLMRVI